MILTKRGSPPACAKIPGMAVSELGLEKLLAGLRSFASIAELRASEFYARSRDKLEALLSAIEVYFCPEARPRTGDFLRLACWNIEGGKAYEAIAELFRSHPLLRDADLLMLSEVDCGLARSGDVNVALELARRLSMHALFAPAYLELDEEGSRLLQGNALLSRRPLSGPRIVPLPCCSEHYDQKPKRYGRRIALVADLDFDGTAIALASTHLEVRGLPQCRRRQMETILDALPIIGPAIIGGDFNTNTFPRNGKLRAMRSFFRLMLTPARRLAASLLEPERHGESLFKVLEQREFAWHGFNDRLPTASARLRGLEEEEYTPGLAARLAERRLARCGGQLQFKLDWIAARGLRPATERELRDSRSGIASAGPRTIPLEELGGRNLSDHAAIIAEVRL